MRHFSPRSRHHIFPHLCSCLIQPDRISYVSELVSDALLSSLGKDELVTMSLVSQLWRRKVFSWPRSQLYAKSPFQAISQLATSFVVARPSHWNHARQLGLHVTRLRFLSDGDNTSSLLTDLPLHSLRSLDLRYCAVSQLGPLGQCSSLHTLNLSGCSRLENVDALGHLQHLRSLNLERCRMLSQVDRIGDCQNLRTLDLSCCNGLTQVDRLGDCQYLQQLDLKWCHGLTQVDRLGDCQYLQELDLYECRGLTQVERIGDCQNLRTLDLGYCTGSDAGGPTRRLPIPARTSSQMVL